MNKKILLSGISLLLCFFAMSQQEVKPADVKLIYNSVNKATISLDFTLSLGDKQIDGDYWVGANQPEIKVRYADKESDSCTLSVTPYVTKHGFGMQVTGFSESTLDRFLAKNKDNQITLVFNSDIYIRLVKAPGEAQPTILVIRKEEANKMIADNLSITDKDKTSFLTALNNFYYYENFVDFGIQPARDTTKSEYFLTLRLQNAYNRKSFLNCKKNKVANPLYWSLKTRLSTDFKDSLNFINFYPVNYHYENFKKVPFQFNAKLGHESNQDFSRKRVAVDGAFNLIIPNLVNLTTASANRLRLKPMIETGLKGYHDYSVKDSSFTSGQVFANLYYYIPVFVNYAIIVEGKTFYDFSKENNPNKKIQGNYSITLGAEIPKTGFKAMFKYVDGKSDINFKQGKIIALGLLIDFFQEKGKDTPAAM